MKSKPVKKMASKGITKSDKKSQSKPANSREPKRGMKKGKK